MIHFLFHTWWPVLIICIVWFIYGIYRSGNP